jgi:hypothetical protein
MAKCSCGGKIGEEISQFSMFPSFDNIGSLYECLSCGWLHNEKGKLFTTKKIEYYFVLYKNGLEWLYQKNLDTGEILLIQGNPS